VDLKIKYWEDGLSEYSGEGEWEREERGSRFFPLLLQPSHPHTPDFNQLSSFTFSRLISTFCPPCIFAGVTTP
jgi:hypothetical protein